MKSAQLPNAMALFFSVYNRGLVETRQNTASLRVVFATKHVLKSTPILFRDESVPCCLARGVGGSLENSRCCCLLSCGKQKEEGHGTLAVQDNDPRYRCVSLTKRRVSRNGKAAGLPSLALRIRKAALPLSQPLVYGITRLFFVIVKSTHQRPRSLIV